MPRVLGPGGDLAGLCRLHRHRGQAAPPSSAADDPSEASASADVGRRIDLEQLRGFVYVGAGALALLAVAVILMGLFAKPDRSRRGPGRARVLRLRGLSRRCDSGALRHGPEAVVR